MGDYVDQCIELMGGSDVAIEIGKRMKGVIDVISARMDELPDSHDDSFYQTEAGRVSKDGCLDVLTWAGTLSPAAQIYAAAKVSVFACETRQNLPLCPSEIADEMEGRSFDVFSKAMDKLSLGDKLPMCLVIRNDDGLPVDCKIKSAALRFFTTSRQHSQLNQRPVI